MAIITHIWMGHVAYITEPWHMHEWVMSHIWMRHCHTCATGKAPIEMGLVNRRHIYKSRMNEPCRTFEWVMLYEQVGTVTYMNRSHTTRGCQLKCASERFMLQMWTSDSCHTCDCVAHDMRIATQKNVWISRVVRMNKAHHTNEWVKSHIWLRRSHDTNEWVMSRHGVKSKAHLNESYRTYEWDILIEWVMSHAWRSHT